MPLIHFDTGPETEAIAEGYHWKRTKRGYYWHLVKPKVKAEAACGLLEWKLTRFRKRAVPIRYACPECLAKQNEYCGARDDLPSD